MKLTEDLGEQIKNLEESGTDSEWMRIFRRWYYKAKRLEIENEELREIIIRQEQKNKVS